MPHSDRDSHAPPRRFDLPVCALAVWVAVMGALYVRAMAAERGEALRAPIAAVAARLGLSTR